jgi:hypothetical protein
MGRTRGEFEWSSANRAIEGSISAWHTSKNTYPCYEVVELIWFISLKDRDWNGQVEKIYYLFLSVITYSCLFLLYLFLAVLIYCYLFIFLSNLYCMCDFYTYLHTYIPMRLWIYEYSHLNFIYILMCSSFVEMS